MRTLIALALLGLAASDEDNWDQQANCLVNGGEAVDDAADAALFIWAAYKRCDKNLEEIKCAVDVTSAIESVNAMVNVMLKAMNNCGHLKKKNAKCGMAAGRLTKNMAGLAAASADIVQKCPNPVAHRHAAVPQFTNVLALCVVDIKDSARSLFKLIREFMQVKQNCKKEDNRHCQANAFRIVGAFGGIGEFLAGAMGHCSKVPKHHEDALCAQASASLLHHAADLAAAGADLSRDCERTPAPAPAGPILTDVVQMQVPRLFEQDGEAHVPATSTNLILVAFLPVTAIVGFFGGRTHAANRMRGEQVRECMSDTE